MNLNRFYFNWNKLKIKEKLQFSVGTILFVLLLVVISCFVSIFIVQSKTEQAILSSTQIQPLVWGMERNLLIARNLHNEFHKRYRIDGFNVAYQKYVNQVINHIDIVVSHIKEFNDLTSNNFVKIAVEENGINLNLYLSSAERYAETFEEFVNLITILANESSGLELLFYKNSTEITKILNIIDNKTWISDFRLIQVFEKEYFNNLVRSNMQLALNRNTELIDKIRISNITDLELKKEVIRLLTNYDSISEELLLVNSRVKSKLNDFDLQNRAVLPISNRLNILVRDEIKLIGEDIKRLNAALYITLTIAMLISVLASILIAKVLDKSLTANILELTKVALKLKEGNLDTPIRIKSLDEIGNLADSFDSMRNSIKTTIRDLKNEIKNREIAETANSAKSVFLSNMSHELRTPLNSILGYSKIIKNKLKKDNEYYKSISIIENSGLHLLNLINEILDLAKIESGKMDLVYTKFETYIFLSQIMDILELKATNKNIYLKLNIQNEIPAIINFDEKRLRQLLLNILNNAIKFTIKGGVTLIVKSNNRDSAITEMEFTIIDTGVGITEEDQKKMFNKFEQVGDKVKQFEGTGLGLSISKKIVELMSGKIEVESEINIGTKFKIKLKIPYSGETTNMNNNKNSLSDESISVISNTPNYQIIQKLLTFTEIHDYDGLELELNRVSKSGSFDMFVRKISKLSSNFEMNKISEYLNSLIKE